MRSSPSFEFTENVGARRPDFLFPDIEKDKLPNGMSSELFQYKDVVSVVATERTSSTTIFDDLSSQEGLSVGQVVNVAP